MVGARSPSPPASCQHYTHVALRATARASVLHGKAGATAAEIEGGVSAWTCPLAPHPSSSTLTLPWPPLQPPPFSALLFGPLLPGASWSPLPQPFCMSKTFPSLVFPSNHGAHSPPCHATACSHCHHCHWPRCRLPRCRCRRPRCRRPRCRCRHCRCPHCRCRHCRCRRH